MDAPQSPVPPDAHDENLDEMLRPRLSPRARALRAGLIGALVVVVALVLVWRTALLAPPPPNRLPTATPNTRSPYVRIWSNVGYGTVTLNGQKQTETLPLVVKLKSGENTLVFEAPPFAASRCSVFWPDAGSNNLACQVYTNDDPRQVHVVGTQEYPLGGYINMLVDGTLLNTDQCAEVLGVVSPVLDGIAPTTTIPKGQRYGAGGIGQNGLPIMHTAQSPLTVRLTTQLGNADQPCKNLEAGGNDVQGHIWDVSVPAALTETFTDASGQLVATNGNSAQGVSLDVMLQVPDDGLHGWSLMTDKQDAEDQALSSLCYMGTSILLGAFQQANPDAFAGIETATTPSVEGCRLTLEQPDENGTVHARGTYLWRFGALFATDATSHQLVPQLPMATAAELAAVPLDSPVRWAAYNPT